MNPRSSLPASKSLMLEGRRASGRAAGGGLLSRRNLLIGGLGIVVAGSGTAAAAVALVQRGVLPGQHLLEELDGACTISAPPLRFSGARHSVSGSFFSQARNRRVGYTIAYPPGYRSGDRLPLVVCLHWYGGTHRDTFAGMTVAQAPSLLVQGKRLRPMAFVSVDGGQGYWNPHPGDDPLGMLVDELIPMCRRLGLGVRPARIGAFGISMGGYGALLLAEKYPRLISAVAALGPAVWTSYAQARSVNPGAYTSPEAFAAADAVTHAAALREVDVFVACGRDDPFAPGVQAVAPALPSGATVRLSKGCHDGSFFRAQEPAALGFLSRHL